MNADLLVLLIQLHVEAALGPVEGKNGCHRHYNDYEQDKSNKQIHLVCPENVLAVSESQIQSVDLFLSVFDLVILEFQHTGVSHIHGRRIQQILSCIRLSLQDIVCDIDDDISSRRIHE